MAKEGLIKYMAKDALGSWYKQIRVSTRKQENLPEGDI